MFAVNARFQAQRRTGVQRYAFEVCSRFKSNPALIAPDRPMNGMKGHIWEQTALPAIARRRMLWSPCNTGPISMKGQILTVHDLSALDHPEWFSGRFASLYRVLLPLLVKRVKHIISVSQFTRQRMIDRMNVPDSKITVIPNGVGSEFRPQPYSETERVTRSLGVPDGPYFLSLCSLEPRKNLRTLLQGWKAFTERIDNATLVIAGAAGNTAVFRTAAFGEIPPRVKFTGYVPESDLPALYGGARAVVYPSLYEGFGLPVLEALSCGTPVITSNTTSIPEIAGPGAVLVDPNSPSELARAMERVLEWTPAQRTAGIVHAGRYTWEAAASATESLLAANI